MEKLSVDILSIDKLVIVEYLFLRHGLIIYIFNTKSVSRRLMMFIPKRTFILEYKAYITSSYTLSLCD